MILYHYHVCLGTSLFKLNNYGEKTTGTLSEPSQYPMISEVGYSTSCWCDSIGNNTLRQGVTRAISPHSMGVKMPVEH